MPTNAVLRIELQSIEPLIWRRVRVPLGWRLDRVHRVFQTVMGWQNRHLHEFRVGEHCIGMPELDDMAEPPPDDERKVSLEQLAKEAGNEFMYAYDFGGRAAAMGGWRL
jgi:Plasmid pRiA4b ORF-3-like protein